MHARLCAPHTVRFSSVDPGEDWDPKQSQSWNMYSYVRNNSVNGTDPDGRSVQLIARELNSTESGISRLTIFRMREGEHVPRTSTIRKVVAALTRLLARRVHAHEVYDVGDAERT
jgi:hypothetical protein